MKELWAKIREALVSALPITLIVYLIALLPDFSFDRGELISFTVGAVLLVLGIGFFNLGADIAMTPMGTHVGAGLSRQKKLCLLLTVCFVLGMLITIAEPDLQVLANQVSSVINGKLLVYVVGFGVGIFLLFAVMRIVFKRRLSSLLMLFYMLLFSLALMLAVNENLDLLPMAFDLGGVTTGPITVPFIMALGIGISIHAEKEILMMFVDKSIRDEVLHAMYKQMGMQKQAQGIVFSLPVSDVAGLVKLPEEEKTKE